MERTPVNVRFDVSADARRRLAMGHDIEMHGHWEFTARDKNGKVKWQDAIDNIVVNVGLNHLLATELAAGTPVTTWYLGLLSATPTVAAGDTMASHSGWTEVVAYDEAARVTWTPGSVASQSVSNTASAARFTISANSTTMGGAFLTSVSTKSGTTGTLYAAGAFTAGNKDLDDNDTLDVTATFTAA